MAEPEQGQSFLWRTSVYSSAVQPVQAGQLRCLLQRALAFCQEALSVTSASQSSELSETRTLCPRAFSLHKPGSLACTSRPCSTTRVPLLDPTPCCFQLCPNTALPSDLPPSLAPSLSNYLVLKWVFSLSICSLLWMTPFLSISVYTYLQLLQLSVLMMS